MGTEVSRTSSKYERVCECLLFCVSKSLSFELVGKENLLQHLGRVQLSSATPCISFHSFTPVRFSTTSKSASFDHTGVTFQCPTRACAREHLMESVLINFLSGRGGRKRGDVLNMAKSLERGRYRKTEENGSTEGEKAN